MNSQRLFTGLVLFRALSNLLPRHDYHSLLPKSLRSNPIKDMNIKFEATEAAELLQDCDTPKQLVNIPKAVKGTV